MKLSDISDEQMEPADSSGSTPYVSIKRIFQNAEVRWVLWAKYIRRLRPLWYGWERAMPLLRKQCVCSTPSFESIVAQLQAREVSCLTRTNLEMMLNGTRRFTPNWSES